METTTDDIPRATVPWNDIFNDALANNLQSVKRHIEEGHYPLNQTNSDQETLAHIAAKQKNIVMLKYLLGKDSSLLNVLDKWDQTVLTVAIDKGAIDIVRYLVDDLKADIYYPHRQRFGNMAIHIAAEEGQLDVLKYLVEEKKVDVNILNYLQEPPVFVAAEKSRFPVVKYLVEKTRTNITALDSNKDNILFVLAVDGDLEITKYLLDERKIFFDVNWQDIFGRTVIYVASRFNQLNFIKYFVEEKGANIHLATNMGWTPMFEASFVGNLDVIKYYLGKGANINHMDQANQTLEDVAFNFPLVRDFFNKTRRERIRRSVANSLSPTFLRPHELNSVHKITKTGIFEAGVKHKLRHNFNPSHLQNLLAIADTVIRSRRSDYQPEHELPLSPSETLNARMEQIAVDTVHDFHNLHI